MRFLARRYVASTSAPPPGRCRRMRPRRRRSAFSFFAQRRCSAGGGTGSTGRTHSSMIVPARRSPRRASSPAASAPPFEWRNGHFSIGARVSGLAVAQSAFHQPWKLIDGAAGGCGRSGRHRGAPHRTARRNARSVEPSRHCTISQPSSLTPPGREANTGSPVATSAPKSRPNGSRCA
jgi:hypothetical protein